MGLWPMNHTWCWDIENGVCMRLEGAVLETPSETETEVRIIDGCFCIPHAWRYRKNVLEIKDPRNRRGIIDWERTNVIYPRGKNINYWSLTCHYTNWREHWWAGKDSCSCNLPFLSEHQLLLLDEGNSKMTTRLRKSGTIHTEVF